MTDRRRAGVSTVFVEVFAVIPGMVENPVKNYFYAAPFCLFNQPVERLVSAEQAIDRLIIPGVVLVV